MPLQFAIHEDLNLVVTTAAGSVTAQDLETHAQELAAVPDRPYRELVDFRDRESAEVDLEAVREMANFLRDHDANPPGSKLAMVATADVVYGSLRVYEAHRAHDSLAIRVFRNREEALDWLGVPPDAID
jgi:hypothetical protein